MRRKRDTINIHFGIFIIIITVISDLSLLSSSLIEPGRLVVDGASSENTLELIFTYIGQTTGELSIVVCHPGNVT